MRLIRFADKKIIKVAQPISTPKEVTVNVYKPPIKFIEGNVYKDAAGQYKVISIDDDTNMTVTYIDGMFNGQTRQYTIISRAKIIHNEDVRQNQLNRMTGAGFTGSGDFFELGYLAKQGMIMAEIPKSQQQWFEEMYTRLTGDKATNYSGGIYQIVKDESKYGLQLRIKFPEPDDQYLAKMKFKNIDVNRTKSGMEINNTNYIKHLFKLGFKLGNNSSNIPAIISKSVPTEGLADFNLGTSI